MADFDSAQLETDLSSICSLTYGGESFRYAGGATTYSGVFAQNQSVYDFMPTGHAADDSVRLVFSRGVLTPSVNVTVYRVGTDRTYRITQARPDIQAWECDLQDVRT